jgi:putative transposase
MVDLVVNRNCVYQTSFPALKKRLWGGHLWSPSYYVGTAGTVDAATVQRYIERAEQVTKRR